MRSKILQVRYTQAQTGYSSTVWPTALLLPYQCLLWGVEGCGWGFGAGGRVRASWRVLRCQNARLMSTNDPPNISAQLPATQEKCPKTCRICSRPPPLLGTGRSVSQQMQGSALHAPTSTKPTAKIYLKVDVSKFLTNVCYLPIRDYVYWKSSSRINSKSKNKLYSDFMVRLLTGTGFSAWDRRFQ